MEFDNAKSILYSDTLVPDIFIAEYMPSADGDFLKVYIYCLFLTKYGKSATVEELSKKLELPEEKVKNALTYWEDLKVISWKDNSIVLTDLKEKEINRIFRLKGFSSPDDALHSSDRNKKRNRIISAINEAFFQGLMSPSWYTDIDAWFNRFNFEEDVMYALFNHCYTYNKLSKNYILKVAESWHNRGIVNFFQLEKYFAEYKKFKDVRLSIIKKLKLSRNLTEYEEAIVEKWVVDYGYDLGIIEIALKKTTSKTNPNFNFLDSIISQWHSNNLKTVEEINAYESAKKASYSKDKKGSPLGYKNYDQRKYGEDYDDSLFINSSWEDKSG